MFNNSLKEFRRSQINKQSISKSSPLNLYSFHRKKHLHVWAKDVLQPEIFIIFISNLPFLGKVLEKVVYQQLSDFWFYVFNWEMTRQNQSGGGRCAIFRDNINTHKIRHLVFFLNSSMCHWKWRYFVSPQNGLIDKFIELL